ncbi:MAG: hypothetical protein HOI01_07790 [Proteobacteria bacterium]|jgi:hypothetical protein|nr:hypothetical protein [Pseudomonadota bacterium]
MKNLLILISAFFLVTPIASAENVEGNGNISGYKCDRKGRYQNLINLTKRDAVLNAASKCSWDMEQPSVKRTSQWDLDVACRSSRSDGSWAVISAAATFQCIYSNRDAELEGY